MKLKVLKAGLISHMTGLTESHLSQEPIGKNWTTVRYISQVIFTFCATPIAQNVKISWEIGWPYRTLGRCTCVVVGRSLSLSYVRIGNRWCRWLVQVTMNAHTDSRRFLVSSIAGYATHVSRFTNSCTYSIFWFELYNITYENSHWPRSSTPYLFGNGPCYSLISPKKTQKLAFHWFSMESKLFLEWIGYRFIDFELSALAFPCPCLCGKILKFTSVVSR